ncbi:MAG TPA: hypothetical protein VLG46_13975 [Anaerolineae bacterium]|nr:hypothetical protein [Anaerolineae bacterium]
MSMMFFADEAEVPLPPREVRITEAVARPAPDGRRVALLITLTPFVEYPNLEVVLYRPDGEEERSLTIIGTMERHLALTLHVKQPMPGEYRTQIDLLYEGDVLQTRHVTFSLPEPSA